MKNAFTLTEVLLAVAIVGIIAALVLPMVSTHYQESMYNHAYKREVDTIESAVEGLSVNENKTNFFETMMYTSSEPEDYKDSSEKFLKKYVKTTKICTEAKDCFAQEYYEYGKDEQNRNVKKEYKPEYKGSCGILKNGMSICITPQIGGEGIHGIIDLNGKKGPNVHNRDLREFSLSSRTRVGMSTETDVVRTLDWENMGDDPPVDPCEGLICGCGSLPACNQDPCDTDPNGLACCQTKNITGSKDACCTYDEIKNSNSKCKSRIGIGVMCDNFPVYNPGGAQQAAQAQCTISLFDGNYNYNTVKFSDLPKDYRVKVTAGIFYGDKHTDSAYLSCDKVNDLYSSKVTTNIYYGHILSPYNNQKEVYEFNISRSDPGSEKTIVFFTSPTKRICYPSSDGIYPIEPIYFYDFWNQHTGGFQKSVWTDSAVKPVF